MVSFIFLKIRAEQIFSEYSEPRTRIQFTMIATQARARETQRKGQQYNGVDEGINR